MKEISKQSQSYKIRVNSEEESQTAQKLFFELGFILNPSVISSWHYDNAYALYAYSDSKLLMYSSSDNQGKEHFDKHENTEISLPQLRDIVVLHRNDVNDATHTKANMVYNSFFVSSKSIVYWYNPEPDPSVWVITDDEIATLEPIKKDEIQADQNMKVIKVKGLDFLIKGTDALRAALDGQTIQMSYEPWEEKLWSDFNISVDESSTKVFSSEHYEGRKIFFRIKPRTIKLTLEIPAPFEPKVGERYCFLDSGLGRGYGFSAFNDDSEKFMQFGAWRTEEEIRQVVAALRQIKGASA